MFDPLFPAVGENMKLRMFNYLNNHDIAFDASYIGNKVDGLPLVVVDLEENLYDSQGLANAGFSSFDADGRESKKHHIFTSQLARVNIYANEIEAVRLLHRLIQASMLLWHTSFIKAGYQNILYMGATPLVPEIRLEGEGLNVYGRSISYAALHLLEIPARIEDLSDVGGLSPLHDIQVQLASSSGVPDGITVSSDSDS